MKTYKEFITELSAGTLARYIAKATGSLRSAAMKHSRNLTIGKPIEYRKYLNKSKTTSSPLGSFEKIQNREAGIRQAARKLAGKAEEQRLDNIIRSTVDGGAPKKITKPTFDKKDPLGINYLSDIGRKARKRLKIGEFKPKKK